MIVVTWLSVPAHSLSFVARGRAPRQIGRVTHRVLTHTSRRWPLPRALGSGDAARARRLSDDADRMREQRTDDDLRALFERLAGGDLRAACGTAVVLHQKLDVRAAELRERHLGGVLHRERNRCRIALSRQRQDQADAHLTGADRRGLLRRLRRLLRLRAEHVGGVGAAGDERERGGEHDRALPEWDVNKIGKDEFRSGADQFLGEPWLAVGEGKRAAQPAQQRECELRHEAAQLDQRQLRLRSRDLEGQPAQGETEHLLAADLRQDVARLRVPKSREQGFDPLGAGRRAVTEEGKIGGGAPALRGQAARHAG